MRKKEIYLMKKPHSKPPDPKIKFKIDSLYENLKSSSNVVVNHSLLAKGKLITSKSNYNDYFMTLLNNYQSKNRRIRTIADKLDKFTAKEPRKISANQTSIMNKIESNRAKFKFDFNVSGIDYQNNQFNSKTPNCNIKKDYSHLYQRINYGNKVFIENKTKDFLDKNSEYRSNLFKMKIQNCLKLNCTSSSTRHETYFNFPITKYNVI